MPYGSSNTGFTGGMLTGAQIDQRRRGGAPPGYVNTGSQGTNTGPAGGLRDPNVYDRDPNYNKERVGDAAADASVKALTDLSTGGAAGDRTLPPRIGGAGGGAPAGGGTVPPRIGAPTGPDHATLQASQDAELLRAKEKQGQIATSSLTGLREALGSRQMLGSGVEGMATADVANEAAGNLSDLNVQHLKDADDSARRLAELSYNGDITQRGQDMGASATYRGQDITQRGQDISAQRSPLDLISILKSLVY